MELSKSNGFLTREVTGGRKSSSEYIFSQGISEGLLDSPYPKMQTVLTILQPLSLRKKSWKAHCLMPCWVFLKQYTSNFED